MSPEKLIQAGVSVSRVVQSAGEFVVVFPQSFAASVSCGFNVGESLRLAPASWFPLGCSAAQVRRWNFCCSLLLTVTSVTPFTALMTLLVGRQEGHPAGNTLGVGLLVAVI